MSSVALVWLVIGLVTAAMVLAVLVALVRHVLVLFRTLGRFGDEVGPLVREIGQGAQQAGDHAHRRSAERSFGGPDGPAVR